MGLGSIIALTLVMTLAIWTLVSPTVITGIRVFIAIIPVLLSFLFVAPRVVA